MASSIVCMPELLTDSFVWVIRGLQLGGYLPFGIINRRLRFGKFWSPLLLWSLLIALLTVGLIYNFLARAKVIVGERVAREVEMLALQTLTFSMGVASLVFKLLSYTYHRRMENFWIQNCKLLEFTCSIDVDGFLDIRSLQHILVKLKKRSKLELLILTAFGIVLLLVVFYKIQGCFNATANAPDRSCYWIIVRSLAIYSIWVFISCIDGCLCFLIVYFLRLYASLFGIIASELRMMSLQTGMNDMWTMVAPIVIETRRRHMSIKRLVRVIDCFYRVDRAVQQLNSLYGPVIVIEIGLAVCFSLGHTFFCICSLLLGNFGNVISDLIWVGLFASIIFLLGTESSNLQSKSQQVAKELMIIARGKIYFGAELAREAKMLAFRITMQPPQLVPGNFFNVDRKLVITIASTITTYLIILLQFRQAEGRPMR